jgi:XTP/dITP diphosphohydrolase
VVVLLRGADDPLPLIAEGVWNGRLLRVPRGVGGFGYDPVFLDSASGRSAAELSAEQKNAVSHRGQALRSLRARLAGAPMP